MRFLVSIGIFFFNIVYFFIKLFPVKHKVTFISRQKNTPSIDFLLLEEKLKKLDPDIKVVILCRKLEKGFKKKVSYVFHMFKQMYHIATSKVVILDSYCIAVSILKHKKKLKVVQMWHALGSLKKFGKSIIGKGESSVDIEGVNKIEMKDLSRIMHMHNNYDYIFASSKVSCIGFSDAFGYSVDKFKVFPLPRVDLIVSKENRKIVEDKIYKKYPTLKKKKNILYCPTFRKDKSDIKYIKDLVNKIDYSKYNLILKLHPLTKTKITDDRVIIDNNFNTYEMGFVSDYIITDYSAVVYELSLLKRPMYFYTYDIDTYVDKRDFYFDYEKEMPGLISKNVDNILDNIYKNNYDLAKVSRFNKKYITIPKDGCSLGIAKFVMSLLNN